MKTQLDLQLDNLRDALDTIEQLFADNDPPKLTRAKCAAVLGRCQLELAKLTELPYGPEGFQRGALPPRRSPIAPAPAGTLPGLDASPAQ